MEIIILYEKIGVYTLESFHKVSHSKLIVHYNQERLVKLFKHLRSRIPQGYSPFYFLVHSGQVDDTQMLHD